MRLILVWFAVMIILTGCKPEQRPEGILPEAEMVSILMKLYLAEERFSKMSIPYDSANNLIPLFRDRVFKELGVPDSVYRMSMEYYMANPKQLEYIYTALVDSLSLQEQSKPNDYTQYGPSK